MSILIVSLTIVALVLLAVGILVSATGSVRANHHPKCSRTQRQPETRYARGRRHWGH